MAFKVSINRRLEIKLIQRSRWRSGAKDSHAPFSHIKERKEKTEDTTKCYTRVHSFKRSVFQVSLCEALKKFIVYFKAFESHCELIGYIHLKCYSRVWNSGSCTRQLICESKRIVLDS